MRAKISRNKRFSAAHTKTLRIRRRQRTLARWFNHNEHIQIGNLRKFHSNGRLSKGKSANCWVEHVCVKVIFEKLVPQTDDLFAKDFSPTVTIKAIFLIFFRFFLFLLFAIFCCWCEDHWGNVWNFIYMPYGSIPCIWHFLSFLTLEPIAFKEIVKSFLTNVQQQDVWFSQLKNYNINF